MPSKSTAAYRALADIRHHIALAQRFVDGMDYADFHGDERTSYAVIRCLEIRSFTAAAGRIEGPPPVNRMAGYGGVGEHLPP